MSRKRRAVSKGRRRRRNPLTRAEAARIKRKARAWRAEGRNIKHRDAVRSYARGAYGGLMQAIRIAGVKKKNPLLQVVLPNRRRRSRRNVPTSGPTRRLREIQWWIGDRVGASDLKDRLGYGKIHYAGLRLAKAAKRLKTRRWNPPSYIKGYPNRGGAKVRGGQRISRVAFVDQKEAATYPGFAKALALHRSFHGRAPTHFTRVRVEDGSPTVTRRAVVLIGEAPAIEYRTWRYQNSTKSHTPSGQRIVWRHKLGEQGGKPAYWVHDPVSGITSLLGGTYKVAGKPAFYHH